MYLNIFVCQLKFTSFITNGHLYHVKVQEHYILISSVTCISSVWFKVSARVKKGAFSKFLISSRSDKGFQELSFKKSSPKNIILVQSYMLIVFITRWQVLSFYSNLYVNMSRNKSQGIVVSFYHAIHAARLVEMPLKKKKRLCLFSPATAKAQKAEEIVKLGLGWKLSGE